MKFHRSNIKTEALVHKSLKSGRRHYKYPTSVGGVTLKMRQKLYLLTHLKFGQRIVQYR